MRRAGTGIALGTVAQGSAPDPAGTVCVALMDPRGTLFLCKFWDSYCLCEGVVSSHPAGTNTYLCPCQPIQAFFSHQTILLFVRTSSTAQRLLVFAHCHRLGFEKGVWQIGTQQTLASWQGWPDTSVNGLCHNVPWLHKNTQGGIRARSEWKIRSQCPRPLTARAGTMKSHQSEMGRVGKQVKSQASSHSIHCCGISL